jgi:hypothetical protein
VRFDHYHHFEGVIIVANEALVSELSNLASALSTKDETIASLSAALESGNSDAVSSAVSSAVDAEDTAIAESISTILSSS